MSPMEVIVPARTVGFEPLEVGEGEVAESHLAEEEVLGCASCAVTAVEEGGHHAGLMVDLDQVGGWFREGDTRWDLRFVGELDRKAVVVGVWVDEHALIVLDVSRLLADELVSRREPS